MKNSKYSLPYRVTSCFVAIVFTLTVLFPPGQGYAWVGTGFKPVPTLPLPGTMVTVSPAYLPPIIKGITIHPENPLLFDFIVHPGDDNLEGQQLKAESTKLIKYFMASLTVPENQMWVNLSPYEKDRIVPDSLGQTEMGRDLLAQDYLLKQLTASLMYPEDELGSEFWDRVYKAAYEKYGTTEIPMNTFNKVWIMPQTASIYENGTSVFVVDSHLKVMLEEDYMAMDFQQKSTAKSRPPRRFAAKAAGRGAPARGVAKGISSDIIREILIPEIEKEVNEGKTFANLRQIYNSVILATWYKQNLKESLLGQVYVDQNKTKGIDIEDKQIKEKIYNQYLEAFKVGVYDYIKEDYDPATKETVPRKYFSGGATFDGIRLTGGKQLRERYLKGGHIVTAGLKAFGGMPMIASQGSAASSPVDSSTRNKESVFDDDAYEYAQSNTAVQKAPVFDNFDSFIKWYNRQTAQTLPNEKNDEKKISASYAVQVLGHAKKIKGLVQDFKRNAGAYKRAINEKEVISHEIQRIWRQSTEGQSYRTDLARLNAEFDPNKLLNLNIKKRKRPLSASYHRMILRYAYEAYGKKLIAQLKTQSALPQNSKDPASSPVDEPVGISEGVVRLLEEDQRSLESLISLRDTYSALVFIPDSQDTSEEDSPLMKSFLDDYARGWSDISSKEHRKLLIFVEYLSNKFGIAIKVTGDYVHLTDEPIEGISPGVKNLYLSKGREAQLNTLVLARNGYSIALRQRESIVSGKDVDPLLQIARKFLDFAAKMGLGSNKEGKDLIIMRGIEGSMRSRKYLVTTVKHMSDELGVAIKVTGEYVHLADEPPDVAQAMEGNDASSPVEVMGMEIKAAADKIIAIWQEKEEEDLTVVDLMEWIQYLRDEYPSRRDEASGALSEIINSEARDIDFSIDLTNAIEELLMKVWNAPDTDAVAEEAFVYIRRNVFSDQGMLGDGESDPASSPVSRDESEVVSEGIDLLLSILDNLDDPASDNENKVTTFSHGFSWGVKSIGTQKRTFRKFLRTKEGLTMLDVSTQPVTFKVGEDNLIPDETTNHFDHDMMRYASEDRRKYEPYANNSAFIKAYSILRQLADELDLEIVFNIRKRIRTRSPSQSSGFGTSFSYIEALTAEDVVIDSVGVRFKKRRKNNRKGLMGLAHVLHAHLIQLQRGSSLGVELQQNRLARQREGQRAVSLKAGQWQLGVDFPPALQKERQLKAIEHILGNLEGNESIVPFSEGISYGRSKKSPIGVLIWRSEYQDGIDSLVSGPSGEHKVDTINTMYNEVSRIMQEIAGELGFDFVFSEDSLMDDFNPIWRTYHLDSEGYIGDSSGIYAMGVRFQKEFAWGPIQGTKEKIKDVWKNRRKRLEALREELIEILKEKKRQLFLTPVQVDTEYQWGDEQENRLVLTSVEDQENSYGAVTTVRFNERDEERLDGRHVISAVSEYTVDGGKIKKVIRLEVSPALFLTLELLNIPRNFQTLKEVPSDQDFAEAFNIGLEWVQRLGTKVVPQATTSSIEEKVVIVESQVDANVIAIMSPEIEGTVERITQLQKPKFEELPKSDPASSPVGVEAATPSEEPIGARGEEDERLVMEMLLEVLIRDMPISKTIQQFNTYERRGEILQLAVTLLNKGQTALTPPNGELDKLLDIFEQGQFIKKTGRDRSRVSETLRFLFAYQGPWHRIYQRERIKFLTLLARKGFLNGNINIASSEIQFLLSAIYKMADQEGLSAVIPEGMVIAQRLIEMGLVKKGKAGEITNLINTINGEDTQIEVIKSSFGALRRLVENAAAGDVQAQAVDVKFLTNTAKKAGEGKSDAFRLIDIFGKLGLLKTEQDVKDMKRLFQISPVEFDPWHYTIFLKLAKKVDREGLDVRTLDFNLLRVISEYIDNRADFKGTISALGKIAKVVKDEGLADSILDPELLREVAVTHPKTIKERYEELLELARKAKAEGIDPIALNPQLLAVIFSFPISVPNKFIDQEVREVFLDLARVAAIQPDNINDASVFFLENAQNIKDENDKIGAIIRNAAKAGAITADNLWEWVIFLKELRDLKTNRKNKAEKDEMLRELSNLARHVAHEDLSLEVLNVSILKKSLRFAKSGNFTTSRWMYMGLLILSQIARRGEHALSNLILRRTLSRAADGNHDTLEIFGELLKPEVMNANEYQEAEYLITAISKSKKRTKALRELLNASIHPDAVNIHLLRTFALPQIKKWEVEQFGSALESLLSSLSSFHSKRKTNPLNTVFTEEFVRGLSSGIHLVSHLSGTVVLDYLDTVDSNVLRPSKTYRRVLYPTMDESSDPLAIARSMVPGAAKGDIYELLLPESLQTISPERRHELEVRAQRMILEPSHMVIVDNHTKLLAYAGLQKAGLTPVSLTDFERILEEIIFGDGPSVGTKPAYRLSFPSGPILYVEDQESKERIIGENLGTLNQHIAVLEEFARTNKYPELARNIEELKSLLTQRFDQIAANGLEIAEHFERELGDQFKRIQQILEKIVVFGMQNALSKDAFNAEKFLQELVKKLNRMNNGHWFIPGNLPGNVFDFGIGIRWFPNWRDTSRIYLVYKGDLELNIKIEEILARGEEPTVFDLSTGHNLVGATHMQPEEMERYQRYFGTAGGISFREPTWTETQRYKVARELWENFTKIPSQVDEAIDGGPASSPVGQRVYEGISNSKITVISTNFGHDTPDFDLFNEDIRLLTKGLENMIETRDIPAGGGLLAVSFLGGLDMALALGSNAIVFADLNERVFALNLSILRIVEEAERVEDVLPRIKTYLKQNDPRMYRRIMDALTEEGSPTGARIELRWAQHEDDFNRLKSLIAGGKVAVAYLDIFKSRNTKVVGQFFEKQRTFLQHAYLSNADEEGRIAIFNSLAQASGVKNTILIRSHLIGSSSQDARSVPEVMERGLNSRSLSSTHSVQTLQDFKQSLEKRWGISLAELPDASSSPVTTENPGGIDLNPDMIEMDRQGNGVKYQFPTIDPQHLQNINIEGFLPVIINISPITDIPLLLGISDKEEEPTNLGYQSLDPLEKRDRLMTEKSRLSRPVVYVESI